jgi:hypothetical protein
VFTIGREVKIRRVKKSDAIKMKKCRICEILVHSYGVIIDPISDSVTQFSENWYQRLDKEPFGWVICKKGRIIGEIILDNFDFETCSAELSIGLFLKSDVGLGTGRIAVCLVLDYAFRVLHLEKITLNVSTSNVRAIRCYQACGFRMTSLTESLCVIEMYVMKKDYIQKPPSFCYSPPFLKEILHKFKAA